MKDAEMKDCTDLAEVMNTAASADHHSRLDIDLDHYKSYLDDPVLTPEQKKISLARFGRSSPPLSS
ncbi:MAG: hypothetical protein AB8B85_12195 [Paracoccaceae bacterium]